MAYTFQGKFAPFIGLGNDNMDLDTMITQPVRYKFGKERRTKKPWIIKDFLDLCDDSRDLKKRRYEVEGAKAYREANKRIQK